MFESWLPMDSEPFRKRNCNAKACLQSPAGKEKRDQTNESSKAGIGLFVASCDASEGLGRAEEVFDHMAPFVNFCIVRAALGPVGTFFCHLKAFGRIATRYE